MGIMDGCRNMRQRVVLLGKAYAAVDDYALGSNWIAITWKEQVEVREDNEDRERRMMY